VRALVFTAPSVVEMQDVAEPEPGDGDVIVEVKGSGICGSELHGFRSLGFRKPPLVMGHEIVGLDAAGRRVAVNPLLTCGRCDLCVRGLPQVCRERELLGVHRPGGFAERVAVPAAALHELPDGVDWEAAAMVEPLANALHALRQVPEIRDARVGVIGAGAIGLLCLLVARRLGAGHVTVVDPSEGRLATASRLGADETGPSLTQEYDAIVDAVGLPTTRADSVLRVRPGGYAVWIGLAKAEATIDGNELVRGERHVVGTFAYRPEEFAEAVALSAACDLGWSTGVPLDDAQRVFMALAEGRSDIVRAVIRP
jgi:2-desacetyl-2-hydroxyethyl bacteriochlorophyllide A dehydrogenase